MKSETLFTTLPPISSETRINTPADLISSYLAYSIVVHQKKLDIDVLEFSPALSLHRNGCGAARTEILFYEKTFSRGSEEHIKLYCIVENNRFQIRSFILTYKTRWHNRLLRHYRNRYFDPIIIGTCIPSRLISFFMADLCIRNQDDTIAGYSSARLTFEGSVSQYSEAHLSTISESGQPTGDAAA